MPNFFRLLCRWFLRHFVSSAPSPVGTEQPAATAAVPAVSPRAEEKGAKPSPLHEQLLRLLEERHEFRYNLLAEIPEFRERGSAAAFRRVTPLDFNTLAIHAIDARIGVWQRDVERVLHSALIPAYHPLTHFMEQLPAWDGRDRLRPLAERISASALWLQCFSVWLRALAAQWMAHPTVTANDLVPLLVSRRQGLRKSTFCRLLMPPELSDYYADKFELTATAAHEPRLAKLGLINLDEFDRYTPRQNATLKNLLQLKSLSVRRSYRQELMALPRVASFIATSNVNEVLIDPTGSRRFVCVEVNAPIDCSPIDHAQLFAQLRSEVLSGAPCYLDRATTEALERSNAPFRVFSPLAERFARFYRVPTTDEPGEWHTVTELYDRFRRRCPAAGRGLSLQTFGREVRSLGFPTAHRRRGNCYRVVEV